MYLLYIYIYIIHIDSYYRVPLPKPTCLQFLVIFTVLGGLLCSVGRNLRRWQRKRCASSFETQHSLSSLDLHSTCACLVSGGMQTLIAAALVIFPWICCQTETKAFIGKYKAGVLETDPKFDRHEEGADHDRGQNSGLCGACEWRASRCFAAWCMSLSPGSMLCLFSVFIWGRGPTSWFFTCTSYIGTAAPRRWHGQKATSTRYLGFCQQVSNGKKICQQMKRQLLLWKLLLD